MRRAPNRTLPISSRRIWVMKRMTKMSWRSAMKMLSPKKKTRKTARMRRKRMKTRKMVPKKRRVSNSKPRRSKNYQHNKLRVLKKLTMRKSRRRKTRRPATPTRPSPRYNVENESRTRASRTMVPAVDGGQKTKMNNWKKRWRPSVRKIGGEFRKAFLAGVGATCNAYTDGKRCCDQGWSKARGPRTKTNKLWSASKAVWPNGVRLQSSFQDALESNVGNAGSTTWTRKSKEQNGLKKSNGCFSSWETKVLRSGVSFPRSSWVELTTLLKTTGTQG